MLKEHTRTRLPCQLPHVLVPLQHTESIVLQTRVLLTHKGSLCWLVASGKELHFFSVRNSG